MASKWTNWSGSLSFHPEKILYPKTEEALAAIATSTHGTGRRLKNLSSMSVGVRMSNQGNKRWAIPGGHVPLNSNGPEPRCVSHDLLCILNLSDQEAYLSIQIYRADRDPIGSQRVRQVRFNDLIDPQAIPPDMDYAGPIESNVPVIVQFSRLDSSQAENAIASTMAFPLD